MGGILTVATGAGIAGRLDAWARAHPGWMVAAVVIAAMLATLLSLSASESPVVLYQDF